jgi:hypothetical protein
VARRSLKSHGSPKKFAEVENRRARSKIGPNNNCILTDAVVNRSCSSKINYIINEACTKEVFSIVIDELDLGPGASHQRENHHFLVELIIAHALNRRPPTGRYSLSAIQFRVQSSAKKDEHRSVQQYTDLPCALDGAQTWGKRPVSVI